MAPGTDPVKEGLSQDTFAAGSLPPVTCSYNISGPFDADLSSVSNQIVVDLVLYCAKKTIPLSVVEHPQSTITCQEKSDLFSAQHGYVSYGDLKVAKGTLLTWKQDDVSRFIVVMSDADSRIDFKEIKKVLNLSKKTDLTMYKGDVESVIGLERGGVSALIGDTSKVDLIYFDQSLVVKGLMHPESRWDFAFSAKHSVFIFPDCLIDFLKDHLAVGLKIKKYAPELPQVREDI